MLHTYIQGHRPFGSREEGFLRFLPYIGMAAILVIWPGPFEQTFIPPSHGGSILNLTLIGQAVSEEKMFKECGLRTTEAYLSNKLTNESKGSGELKVKLTPEPISGFYLVKKWQNWLNRVYFPVVFSIKGV